MSQFQFQPPNSPAHLSPSTTGGSINPSTLISLHRASYYEISVDVGLWEKQKSSGLSFCTEPGLKAWPKLSKRAPLPPMAVDQPPKDTSGLIELRDCGLGAFPGADGKAAPPRFLEQLKTGPEEATMEEEERRFPSPVDSFHQRFAAMAAVRKQTKLRRSIPELRVSVGVTPAPLAHQCRILPCLWPLPSASKVTRGDSHLQEDCDILRPAG
ncbi:hypothetical protein NHX12_027868 [Muraenolepis orangiensis]|uniref:Uncharacterized protein n=1 Tax=Muraenolepis orangiensis TaxID=630683 RepID=A0A9Q0EEG0_9TELE|nr:hypothetical protein NHX12_027868 [Muraenolepis orangiensis]